ncbi:unnamed protein product [Caenorhabditis auriculariae]|uniref:Uncharacterized protein n=1 Tax=Caenorhabditis auriculariae TaxID=2777116 RepID=A0A8S1H094_9PELO|nr:unnamed protein product [Caenorhabditis auriculariae]
MDKLSQLLHAPRSMGRFDEEGEVENQDEHFGRSSSSFREDSVSSVQTVETDYRSLNATDADDEATPLPSLPNFSTHPSTVITTQRSVWKRAFPEPCQ